MCICCVSKSDLSGKDTRPYQFITRFISAYMNCLFVLIVSTVAAETKPVAVDAQTQPTDMQAPNIHKFGEDGLVALPLFRRSYSSRLRQ